MHSGNGTSKKRRRGSRIFRLKTFCDPGHPVHFKAGSSFQENVSSLLEFGNQEESLHGPATRCWSFQLEVHRNPPSSVLLFVVEEMVEKSHPLRCQHCSFIGWGHHMICRKRFHFLLPSKNAFLRSNEHNCKVSGKSPLVAMRESRLMEVQGLLMHGVVHSNGFGHLLCVNGIEAGSEILSGCQIVELWDRICKGLELRKVSLMDTARKGAMDLRLIHGVAYGEPWFGLWGYRFDRGGYGVTLQMYQRSVDALRRLPLCFLLPHYGSSRPELAFIITKYQAMASHSLVTLGHLLQFMLDLKGRLLPDAFAAMDYRRITMEPACRWSTRRLEMAAQVIVDALRRANFRWVSRQDVREAARAYVGDTGLLDFVLKSLGNQVVGNYVVRRMVNPATKILQYCLEDVSGEMATVSGPKPPGGDPRSERVVRLQTTRVQLKKDLFSLYKYVLMDQNPAPATGVFAAVPVAVKTILDTKLLVKDYWKDPALESKVGGEDRSIKLLCTVHPSIGAGGEGRRQALPPYELLTLPGHATIGNLKMAVERTFRDMYLGLTTFAAKKVVDVDAEDSELVFGKIETGSRLVISGTVDRGAVGREGTYEGCDRAVDCRCGVKEEDGERMVGCDICGVWQHTRCAGRADGEGLLAFFICGQCQHDIALLPSFLP
ncbi:hypothetical protein Taro_041326 [Colocasia esculenta]|uniref:Zinc finger PHD-type domain-containing protein n=1 Tax=Colocasia esculenta TaxID=4460 RepID=A0A843WFI1_COLES|nr:hypothetical protein [Colocasia esculenta]